MLTDFTVIKEYSRIFRCYLLLKREMKIFRLVIGVFLLLATASNGFAKAVIPTTDAKGSMDNPLLRRYNGSLIISCDHKD